MDHNAGPYCGMKFVFNRTAAEKKFFLAICIAALFLSCGTSPKKSAKANVQPVPATEVEQQPTQAIVPPEIVRSKNMRIANGLKILTMANATGDYVLSCSLKAAESCITPTPGKKIFFIQQKYLLEASGCEEFH